MRIPSLGARRATAILGLAAMLVAGAAPAVHPDDDREATLWIGPEPLVPEEQGIGRPVDDLSFLEVYGGSGSLHGEGGPRGTVVVVRDPECPVSKRYGPRIARLADRYHRKGFNFLFIYLNERLSPMDLARDVRDLGAPGTYVGRGSFALAEALGVKSTGDVFLLDERHRLVYRGAVDDQYGLGYTRDYPTHNYLRNALQALMEQRPVPVPATTAPGCFIDADPDQDEFFETIPLGGAVSGAPAGGWRGLV